MTHRATITLDPEVYDFLVSAGRGNRSALINDLLKREMQRQLEQSILRSNLEEAQDPSYFGELLIWDDTLEDGI